MRRKSIFTNVTALVAVVYLSSYRRMKNKMSDKYVICVNNEGFELHLTLFKVYRLMPSKKADKLELYRLVDDSGEDYGYPAPLFRPIELPVDVQEMLAWNPPGAAAQTVAAVGQT